MKNFNDKKENSKLKLIYNILLYLYAHELELTAIVLLSEIFIAIPMWAVIANLLHCIPIFKGDIFSLVVVIIQFYIFLLGIFFNPLVRYITEKKLKNEKGKIMSFEEFSEKNNFYWVR